LYFCPCSCPFVTILKFSFFCRFFCCAFLFIAAALLLSFLFFPFCLLIRFPPEAVCKEQNDVNILDSICLLIRLIYVRIASEGLSGFLFFFCKNENQEMHLSQGNILFILFTYLNRAKNLDQTSKQRNYFYTGCFIFVGTPVILAPFFLAILPCKTGFPLAYILTV
jgi:hypothetical protein